MPLSPAAVTAISEGLFRADSSPGSPFPRPLHVLYGGAHLFSRGTIDKLGARARLEMEKWGADDRAFGEAIGVSDPEVAARTAARVRAKLAASPVDALCIDFEDGYGPRSDKEEDAEATRAAMELVETAPGPLVGIRIKALTSATFTRAVRTLDLFVGTLAASGPIRPGFTVTLPKVTRPEEVRALVGLLDELGLPAIGLELMIETPSALLAARAIVDAGAGRVVAVHLGAYDLTAELGVGARDQSLDHPYNELARMMLKLALPDVGVSDGATTTLPLGTDAAAIHRAWKLHATNVRHAIKLGIWQGWDLHPAQLPARWGAVFASFLEERHTLAERLATFVGRATQASRVGQAFDDAATAQAIVAFFRRGLACGALDDSDLAATTLTRSDLERSFAEIARSR